MCQHQILTLKYWLKDKVKLNFFPLKHDVFQRETSGLYLETLKCVNKSEVSLHAFADIYPNHD